MQKNYILFLLSALVMLEAKPLNLYDDCEEYYDSRGFYHNECTKEKATLRDALQTIDEITKIVEPGDGNTSKKDKISTTKENDKALKERPEYEFGRE